MPGEHDETLASTARYRLRGHRKWAVIRDLADGMGYRTAAKKWGVHAQSMLDFKKANTEEIHQLQAVVGEELISLWVTSKFARVAEYQQLLEDINEILADLAEGKSMTAADMALAKEKRSILRQVAEELGQLPSRNNVQIAGATVTYQFEGIDPADLQ